MQPFSRPATATRRRTRSSPAVPRADPTTGLPPFESLLAGHGVEIYRYLRRFAPTPEDAADLHQETFLRAYRAYAALPAEANVRAWLYRIATNAAHDAHRRRMRRAPLHGPWALVPWSRPPGNRDEPGAVADEPRAGRDTDPHAAAVANELAGAVRAALLTLTKRQRVAVVARVFEEQDYATVAELLDCSEVTARQHVHHGLERLRALLSQHLEVSA